MDKSLNLKTVPESLVASVICGACDAKDSIKWDKHTIGIDDKKGSYKDLSFNYCEECGNVTNVDFS